MRRLTLYTLALALVLVMGASLLGALNAQTQRFTCGACLGMGWVSGYKDVTCPT